MPAPHDPTRTSPPSDAHLARNHDPAGQTTDALEAIGTTTQLGSAIGASPGPSPSTRYLLGEEIARGGMGVVCRATDTLLDREVAVKLLHEKYATRSAAVRRFLSEARIAGRLQHPAIPPVHDMGTLPDGRPFLAMKLIRGRTLAEEMAERQDRAHDRGRLVAAFTQMCQAVAYAHAQRVIHRDLKPLNVMVGAFGEVQVMDWGLAKELGDAVPTSVDLEANAAAPENASIDQTRDGSVMGTPGYMPPEQARGEIDRVDRRADVFAIGAILCEVLTGVPPYGTDSTAEVLSRAMAATLGPAFESLDRCGADEDLIALCKWCLSADPAARPPDAGAVAAAVAEYQVASEERAWQAERKRAADEARLIEERNTRREADAKAEERRKRQRVQWALVGSVLLLAIAGIFGAMVSNLWRTAETNRAEAVSHRDIADEAKRIAERAQLAEAKARESAEDSARALSRQHRLARTVQVVRTLAEIGEAARTQSQEELVVALNHWDTLVTQLQKEEKDKGAGEKYFTAVASKFHVTRNGARLPAQGFDTTAALKVARALRDDLLRDTDPGVQVELESIRTASFQRVRLCVDGMLVTFRDRSFDTAAPFVREFWLNYWGDMGLVEGRSVTSAMVAFGAGLDRIRGRLPAFAWEDKLEAYKKNVHDRKKEAESPKVTALLDPSSADANEADRWYRTYSRMAYVEEIKELESLAVRLREAMAAEQKEPVQPYGN